MSTAQVNQAQRWGKLEDSYENSELEGANPNQTPHFMKEDTNITGQKVTIYAGLQFDVQEKTLADKAKQYIADNAPKVQEQITTTAKLGLSGLVGFAKFAGGFVYGKVADLVQYIEKEQQEKKIKEKEKIEEEQKNQEPINDNWEFVVKGSTPAEILQELEQSESSGTYKITRINNAQSMKDMTGQQDGRIIQLENSSASFYNLVDGHNLDKANKNEFEMINSSLFEMRGALQASMDPQQFEEMRLKQLEIACNQQLNWDMIFNLSGPMANDIAQNDQQYNTNLIAQQQQQQQQQQQEQQQPQQIYPSVYQVDTFAPPPENTNQLGDMSQYSNLIKINLPSFNILTQSKYNQQQQEQLYQQQQMEQMQQAQKAQQQMASQQPFPQFVNSNYPHINANDYRYPPAEQQQQYYEEQEQEAMLN